MAVFIRFHDEYLLDKRHHLKTIPPGSKSSRDLNEPAFRMGEYFRVARRTRDDTREMKTKFAFRFSQTN